MANLFRTWRNTATLADPQDSRSDWNNRSSNPFWFEASILAIPIATKFVMSFHYFVWVQHGDDLVHRLEDFHASRKLNIQDVLSRFSGVFSPPLRLIPYTCIEPPSGTRADFHMPSSGVLISFQSYSRIAWWAGSNVWTSATKESKLPTHFATIVMFWIDSKCWKKGAHMLLFTHGSHLLTLLPTQSKAISMLDSRGASCTV